MRPWGRHAGRSPPAPATARAVPSASRSASPARPLAPTCRSSRRPRRWARRRFSSQELSGLHARQLDADPGPRTLSGFGRSFGKAAGVRPTTSTRSSPRIRKILRTGPAQHNIALFRRLATSARRSPRATSSPDHGFPRSWAIFDKRTPAKLGEHVRGPSRVASRHRPAPGPWKEEGHRRRRASPCRPPPAPGARRHPRRRGAVKIIFKLLRRRLLQVPPEGHGFHHVEPRGGPCSTLCTSTSRRRPLTPPMTIDADRAAAFPSRTRPTSRLGSRRSSPSSTPARWDLAPRFEELRDTAARERPRCLSESNRRRAHLERDRDPLPAAGEEPRGTRTGRAQPRGAASRLVSALGRRAGHRASGGHRATHPWGRTTAKQHNIDTEHYHRVVDGPCSNVGNGRNNTFSLHVHVRRNPRRRPRRSRGLRPACARCWPPAPVDPARTRPYNRRPRLGPATRGGRRRSRRAFPPPCGIPERVRDLGGLPRLHRLPHSRRTPSSSTRRSWWSIRPHFSLRDGRGGASATRSPPAQGGRTRLTALIVASVPSRPGPRARRGTSGVPHGSPSAGGCRPAAPPSSRRNFWAGDPPAARTGPLIDLDPCRGVPGRRWATERLLQLDRAGSAPRLGIDPVFPRRPTAGPAQAAGRIEAGEDMHDVYRRLCEGDAGNLRPGGEGPHERADPTHRRPRARRPTDEELRRGTRERLKQISVEDIIRRDPSAPLIKRRDALRARARPRPRRTRSDLAQLAQGDRGRDGPDPARRGGDRPAAARPVKGALSNPPDGLRGGLAGQAGGARRTPAPKAAPQVPGPAGAGPPRGRRAARGRAGRLLRPAPGEDRAKPGEPGPAQRSGRLWVAPGS